jgi:hypothetical protein
MGDLGEVSDESNSAKPSFGKWKPISDDDLTKIVNVARKFLRRLLESDVDQMYHIFTKERCIKDSTGNKFQRN